MGLVISSCGLRYSRNRRIHGDEKKESNGLKSKKITI